MSHINKSIAENTAFNMLKSTRDKIIKKEIELPEMCCSGRECGCMGMPIDPIICSEQCYNNLPFNKQRHDTKKHP